MQEIIRGDPDASDEEMQEMIAKKRKQKKWNFDAWEALKEVVVPIKVEDLTQLPQLRKQIREGLSQNTPGFKLVEVETMHSEDRPKKSAAYIKCKIENTLVDCILDTGAGGVVISKYLLDKLGWPIEKPTRQQMTVADGRSSTPLGRVFQLPIQFGKLVIPSEALVVDTRTYDLLIGNDWITAVKAVIDMGNRRMMISWKGREEHVPIDTEKGIRPSKQENWSDEEEEESEEEEGEYNVVQFQEKQEEGHWSYGYKYGDDNDHKLQDLWVPKQEKKLLEYNEYG